MKLKYRGSMLVEYALVLSFVVVVGVMFMNHNELADGVAGVFGKANTNMELATAGPKPELTPAEKLTTFLEAKETGKTVKSIGNFSMGNELTPSQLAFIEELKAVTGVSTMSVQRYYNTTPGSGNPVLYVHLGDYYDRVDHGKTVTVTKYEFSNSTGELLYITEGTTKIAANGDGVSARFDGGSFKAL